MRLRASAAPLPKRVLPYCFLSSSLSFSASDQRGSFQSQAACGREAVVFATLRFQFHRNNRRRSRDLSGKRGLKRAAGLRVVLAAEMDFLVAAKRAEDGQLVGNRQRLGEQSFRKV